MYYSHSKNKFNTTVTEMSLKLIDGSNHFLISNEDIQASADILNTWFK